MSESEAIVVREPQSIAPQTQRGILTREALVAASEQRRLLAAYIKEQMVEGTDYGVIPGTKDKTLLKPGAEKLVEIFRCTPKFTITEKIEDYERGLFAYTFRVRLFQRDVEAVLAEGYGSANSYEGRYRWRNAGRKCPQCGKETIIQGKAEYGGGWLCFGKKGGCGAKFKAGDKVIEGQETGKIINDDIATLANTILKMAKKRALVDGAIALARVSDMFKQDLEDMAANEEPHNGSTAEADAMITELGRGFMNWDAKRAWADANKERKAALQEYDRERVTAAFKAAPPTRKPAEPPPATEPQPEPAQEPQQ